MGLLNGLTEFNLVLVVMKIICAASRKSDDKIHHAYGIDLDYHHMHGAGTTLHE
jgi:hypothetical protein